MSVTSTPPRDGRLDATLALMRDPYRYISRCARRLGTDVFETRLLLRPTYCMTGREAAELFYDPQRFARAGASPAPLQRTLLGVGGVQGLDGEAHAQRKQLLLSLTTDTQVADLIGSADSAWNRSVARWCLAGRVDFYAAMQDLLARAACAWAGVPLPEAEAEARTRDLAALFDAAGSAGPAHLRARRARTRCERWAAEWIDRIRAGELPASDGRPAQAIALWLEDGKLLLPREVAAVELLNLLRPAVAVSVWCVWVAHALHAHPERAEKLRAAPRERECFVQEVRRFYPFFPAVPARVRDDFEWRGVVLRGGTRALLDLFGTNRDPRIWGDPGVFRPERFHGAEPDPFAFVPQGGGDAASGHRCPGEGVAVALMLQALHFLVDVLEYRVADADLRIDYARLPALPRRRLQLASVRIRS